MYLKRLGTLIFALGAVALVSAGQVSRAVDDPAPSEPPPAPLTVIDGTAARGILGHTVKGADGKDMGRIVDVVVDPKGKARAAVIDFGGFFGVGSRKIAVDWGALRFAGAVKQDGDIKIDLTGDQLKAAPEYKEGKPLVVIVSSGTLEQLDFPAPHPAQ